MESSDESEGRVTRRKFVETAAAGAAVLGVTAGTAKLNLGGLASGLVKQQQPAERRPQTSNVPSSWDYNADVVIIGAGGAGLPAALTANALDASVIVVDQNYDTGGKAICSGGYEHLGGGNAAQIAASITDSPDLYFSDLTDWTVMQPNGAPDYRYNDPNFIRAFADNSVATFNLIVANGYTWATGPTNSGGLSMGNSAPRDFIPTQTPGGSAYAPGYSIGGALYARPLEFNARTKGVQFLLNYRMTSIVRQTMLPAPAGPVLGVVTQYTGGRIMPGSATPLTSYATEGNIVTTQPTINIQANKAVIIATGGHCSNVNLRMMFDPRLTAHIPCAGEPYSYSDGSGLLAANAIGASLWGLANETLELGIHVVFGFAMGTRYNFVGFPQGSPIFPLAGATGISVSNKQDVIYVNQVGNRFYNEMAGTSYPFGNEAGSIKPYTADDYLQTQYFTSNTSPGTPYDATDYQLINAALALNSVSSAPDWSPGPVWAIFDSAAVTREKWTVTYPYVDTANGYFFSASTLTGLAAALSQNPYQTIPMSGATLTATVNRYNSFVTSGVDTDFGKPKPLYQISTPPFYAAWTTPIMQDSRSGLRTNSKMQVMDFTGNVIPNLYAAGEVIGGITQHGLGRCSVAGYIAGTNAAGGTTPE